MRQPSIIAAIILAFTLTSPPGYAEREKDIPLKDVPRVVLQAVRNAVPGIELHEAEVMQTSKGKIFELEGTANGKSYEINLNEKGELLRLVQVGWHSETYDD